MTDRRDEPAPAVHPDATAARPVIGALGDLRRQLDRLESLVAPELRAATGAAEGHAEAAGRRLGPAWQRTHAGESRLPVALAVLVAIGCQVALPRDLSFRPTWLLPALESALLIGITAANPRRIDRASTWLRWTSIGLIALISLANGWSSVELVHGLVIGSEGQRAGPLLISGGSIYLTNIVVFALWYWEWDRGGAVARVQARRPLPDFLFPQMTAPHLASPTWIPTFLDYLYLSFTNATAFSPTDTMPMAHWAKVLMLLQSAVALVTVALVVARAVNILK